eukprot:COSAG05_NODE_2279_length_3291_cov_50.910324_3_plen_92_part_00
MLNCDRSAVNSCSLTIYPAGRDNTLRVGLITTLAVISVMSAKVNAEVPPSLNPPLSHTSLLSLLLRPQAMVPYLYDKYAPSSFRCSFLGKS